MPFHFKYDGKQVDIDDVPLSVYADIEDATKVTWYQLSAAPARYARAAELLAKECAKIVGVTLPPLTPAMLVDVFDLVEEPNRPVEYTDGMPDPKAEGSEPGTT